MLDPDSWPVWLAIIQLPFALAFLTLCMLYFGIRLEKSSQKDISDSGVGLPLEALSALLLAIPFAVWTVVCFRVIARQLLIANDSPNSAPTFPAYLGFCLVWMLFLFVVFALFTMLPMSMGRAYSERTAGKLKFMHKICSFLRPLARLMTLPARMTLEKRGVAGEIGSVTEEELLEMVDTVEEKKIIDENQKEMIGNIFELNDMKVADIMTHRTEITSVPATASTDQIIQVAVEFGYSRIPVYEGTVDRIIGVANVKDFLPYVNMNDVKIDIRKLMRPTFFVPESRRASELLFDFKQKKMQIAVVVDEYGGTAGIVTMEDILESIVGDIEDEFDDEEEVLIYVNADGSLVCDGFAEVEDVFDAMGIDDLPEDIESDTIGGFLTDLLARIPKKGEQPSVQWNQVELTALDVDERRITKVQARRTSREND